MDNGDVEGNMSQSTPAQSDPHSAFDQFSQMLQYGSGPQPNLLG